jgi:hypothetical protein
MLIMKSVKNILSNVMWPECGTYDIHVIKHVVLVVTALIVALFVTKEFSVRCTKHKIPIYIFSFSLKRIY